MTLTKHKHIEYDILSQLFYELGDYDDICQDVLVLDDDISTQSLMDDIRDVLGSVDYNLSTTKEGNKKYVLYYGELFIYFKEKFKKLSEES